MRINLGLKSVDITNEKDEIIGTYEFLPSDPSLITKCEDFYTYLENRVIGEEDEKDNFATMNKEIKEQFDSFLGAGNGESIFKTYQPMVILANGDFFFEVMLEEIVKDVEKELDVRIKKKQAKIKKLTANAKKYG